MYLSIAERRIPSGVPSKKDRHLLVFFVFIGGTSSEFSAYAMLKKNIKNSIKLFQRTKNTVHPSDLNNTQKAHGS